MRLGALALVLAACGSSGDGVVVDAASVGDSVTPIDSTSGVESNRDRLIRTYLERLHTIPTVVQTNGVRGADVADACALWTALTPSARATFLTITARLEGSTIVATGDAMLDHVTRMTKVNGGDGSTARDPGACGGDGNRLFLTTDDALHLALVSVAGGGGDLDDVGAHGAWGNTGDAAGPHAPFDASDETEDGAPRGQGHFFADPTSAVATQALGRIDVETLVDPFAFEIDQDYDCVHASNPLCDYTFYGSFCAPETTQQGAAIFTQNYGDFDPTWEPAGC